MRGRQISTIYFYFISAIALILLVIGLYHSLTYAINVTQYDEYPLRYARNCVTEYPAPPIVQDPRNVNIVELPTTSLKIDQEETERRRNECKRQLAFERKRQQLDDLRNVLVFSAAGLILFVTHFPIALRRSNHSS